VSTSLKGALILLIVIILIVVAIAFLRPVFFEKGQRATSDASATEEIHWAGDGYIGYFFLRSTEIKKQAPRSGIELKFTDDGGAYADRLQNFSDGEYDFIVLPIAEYIRHGLKHKYPGVVVSALAGSKGADAIVGFPDLMPNGKINELNDASIRIVYTSASPSSFLLDLTISDFDLDQLQNDNSWRYEVGSSEEVYSLAEKSFKNNDRSIGDAFVLWEPEVSKAVEKLGMKVLWSSEYFSGYIEDVIVFHRDLVQKENGQLAVKLLKTYFRVFDSYAADKDRMIADMSKVIGLNKDVVENMIKKIDFYDLRENCSQQFGIATGGAGSYSDDRIIGSIIACVNVMDRVGTFDASELIDPYRIVNSSFLEQLYQSGVRSLGGTVSGALVEFESLSDAEWSKLTAVGTMRIEPVTFQSGTNRLDDAGKEIVDRVAQMLINNYPDFRVEVGGHTGTGDEQANKKLSDSRAQIVMQRLIAVHQIDPDRLRAVGYGSTRPPHRKSGESKRSLRFRMPRVEFVLKQDNVL
jgi:outer membrane protein OmpA-like peptidoglycan-associated protein